MSGLLGLLGCSVVGKDLDGYFSGDAGDAGGSAGSGASGGTAGNGGSAGSGATGASGAMGGSAGVAGSSGSGGTSGAGGCGSRQPPTRPAVQDTGSGAPTTIWVLKDIVIDQPDPLWKDIGFDLDGVCTQPPDNPVECLAENASGPQRDGNAGVDNAFGSTVIPLLKAADVTIQQSAQSNQNEGKSAIVVHVDGWNGEDDDPSVQVWMAETAYAIPDGSTDPGMPSWDGTDSFYVPDAAFNNGDVNSPVIGNDNAYVAGRVLVMRLPDRSAFPFQTSDGQVFLKLTDATLTGQISADGRSLANVQLAGRWGAQDVLDTLVYINICPNSLEYGLVQNLLQNSADIRATKGTGGPGAVCDAVSIGIQLTGYPGKFGGLIPSQPLVNPCAGSGGAGGKAN
ncbi:MAG: hypothetical protein KC766_29635 [Myxococcales bacterium]|nr:hypothetical protein [Myxococcales bacterium]